MNKRHARFCSNDFFFLSSSLLLFLLLLLSSFYPRSIQIHQMLRRSKRSAGLCLHFVRVHVIRRAVVSNAQCENFYFFFNLIWTKKFDWIYVFQFIQSKLDSRIKAGLSKEFKPKNELIQISNSKIYAQINFYDKKFFFSTQLFSKQLNLK